MAPPRDKPPMPTPLVPAALLLAAGIAAGRFAGAPLGAWLVFGGAALAGGLLALARPGLTAARAALAAGVFAAGGCLSVLALGHAPSDHVVAALPSDARPLATLTGRIANSPEVREDDRLFAPYEQPPRTIFLLDADSVSTAAGVQGCTGLVRVQVQGPAPALRVGQRVRIVGRAYKPGPPSNPGEYNARRAGRLDGVLAGFTAEAAEAVEVLDDSPAPLARVLHAARSRSRRQLAASADWQDRLLLRTLLLGDRHSQLQGLQQSMTRSGLAHFLSISGLHLGILLGFLYLLLRGGRLAPAQAATVVLVLLGGYLLMAEPRTPLLRAGIMAAAFCLGVLLGRSATAANLLALAAIVLLAADPRELFRPAFQLSFGTVAGLMVLYRPVKGLLFGRWLRRRGLVVYRDDQRFRRWLHYRFFDRLCDLVSLSAAANLSAAPLVAYHFGVLAPLAALVSIVLMPVVAATLVVGYVQLVLSWLLPNLAALLSGPLALLAGTFARWAAAAESLPLASIELQPIGAWSALLLAAALLAVSQRHRLGWSRATAALVLLAAVGTVWAATQRTARPAGDAELAVLDVGAGQCAVLRTPAGQTVLLDAGSINRFDPDAHVLRPFLREARWPSPCAAFVSHANSDHYNALPGLLGRHRLGRAFVSDAFDADAAAQTGVRLLMGELARAGTEVRRLNRGQSVRLGERTTVTALWPPRADQGYAFEDVNDSSLVLRLECDGVRALLPGDAGELAQQALLELPAEELRADVLVLPHHGGYTPALARFVEAVDPAVVIRSSGPRRGGAAQQIPTLTVNRAFFATDRDGCVTVRFTTDGPVVRSFLHPQQR